jgi:class 3 adenylate cyclase
MWCHESGTLAALKATCLEVVDPAIASHEARILKTTGDGLPSIAANSKEGDATLRIPTLNEGDGN